MLTYAMAQWSAEDILAALIAALPEGWRYEWGRRYEDGQWVLALYDPDNEERFSDVYVDARMTLFNGLGYLQGQGVRTPLWTPRPVRPPPPPAPVVSREPEPEDLDPSEVALVYAGKT